MSYVRPVNCRYLDPIELVWYATARRLGLRVGRNPAIFSLTDGTGLLELGPKSTLDADDSAAQMIFHELCHWITNGEESFTLRDWGFPLDDELDWREHACLRLQAALADGHGLRRVLAPTSPFREYYDQLPQSPFEPLDGEHNGAEILALAQAAWRRSSGPPWGDALHAALSATARITEVISPFLSDYATDLPDDDLPSLWARACPSSG